MNVFGDEFYNDINKKLDEKGFISDFDGNLEELFVKIDEYVKKFYYFNVKSYGYIYNFKHNSDKYEISKTYGPNVFYMLKRSENAANYIDIKDVEHGVLSGKENIEVFNLMSEIMSCIQYLDRMNVPADSISNEVNRKLSMIKRR